MFVPQQVIKHASQSVTKIFLVYPLYPLFFRMPPPSIAKFLHMAPPKSHQPPLPHEKWTVHKITLGLVEVPSATLYGLCKTKRSCASEF